MPSKKCFHLPNLFHFQIFLMDLPIYKFLPITHQIVVGNYDYKYNCQVTTCMLDEFLKWFFIEELHPLH
jgi:hypothetical protein